MKFRSSIRFVLPALLAFILISTGCDSEKGTGENGVSKDAAIAYPKLVRIGYFGNATHAQAVLGDASGDLAVAVAPATIPDSPKIFNAGPSLIEAINGGEIDIGYVGPSPVLAANAISKGKGIRVLAGAAANGVVIVARRDSGIKTLADLKGKKIATPQLGNTQDVSARHYLLSELHQADLNNVLPIANAEQLALMLRGEIDAAWAPEPWGARLVAEAGGQIVAEEKDLWPDKEFTLTLVVTTPKFLAEHPDVVEKVLAVHRRWTARLQKNPGAYEKQLGDALLKINKKPLPPGVLTAALSRVKFTDEPLEKTLGTFGQWSYDLKLTQQPANLNGLVDTAILRKLQAGQPDADPAPGGK